MFALVKEVFLPSLIEFVEFHAVQDTEMTDEVLRHTLQIFIQDGLFVYWLSFLDYLTVRKVLIEESEEGKCHIVRIREEFKGLRRRERAPGDPDVVSATVGKYWVSLTNTRWLLAPPRDSPYRSGRTSLPPGPCESESRSQPHFLSDSTVSVSVLLE